MLPVEFLERIKGQLGEEYPDFLQSLERPRAVALRFNPLKGAAPALPFVKEPVPWEPHFFIMPFRPRSDQATTASGVSSLPPGSRSRHRPSGLIPCSTRVKPRAER